METSQSSRRKRPITACTECVRRKQKCNRQHPCGGCIARNVEDRCVFPKDGEQVHEPTQRPLHVQLESTSLSASLGYPPNNKIRETLDDLQNGQGDRIQRNGVNGTSGHAEAFQGPPEYQVLISQLPAEAVIVDIADIFFSEADWYFCVLDRPYYEELWSLWKARAWTRSIKQHQRPSHPTIKGVKTVFVRDPAEIRYFPAMLFQMLALTLHFLPSHCITRDLMNLTDQIGTDKLSKTWSDAGHGLMAVLGRIDSPMTACLADLLRCTWLKNSGLGSHSWHVLSDAVRQAQNLDLYQKATIAQSDSVEDTMRNLWYDEHRRRVWISIFSWDSHMALGLGRPRLINAGDCTVETPLDCDLPADPLKVIPAAATVVGRPSRFTSQLFKYQTGLLIHEAMSVGALRSPCRDYNSVLRLHRQMDDLVNSLPSMSRQDALDTSWDSLYENLPKQRQQISIVAASIIMALHRPHVLQHAASRTAAISAAIDTLNASQSLFELCSEQHYKIHSLLFYTIDAVIFLSSMVLTHARTSRKNGMHSPMPGDDIPLHNIRYALYQALQRVATMRSRSDVAREGEKAVRKCYELVAKHEQEYRASVNNTPMESPNTTASTVTSNTSEYLNILTDAPMEAKSASAQLYGDANGHMDAKMAAMMQPPPPPLVQDFEFLDTSGYEDMSEFLYDPQFVNNAANTANWMEQHGFFDESLSMVGAGGFGGGYGGWDGW